jgi:hypothetical protein
MGFPYVKPVLLFMPARMVETIGTCQAGSFQQPIRRMGWDNVLKTASKA